MRGGVTRWYKEAVQEFQSVSKLDIRARIVRRVLRLFRRHIEVLCRKSTKCSRGELNFGGWKLLT